MSSSRLVRRGALLCTALAGLASAQTQSFPFQLLVIQQGNAIIVPNGAALGFSASIGQSVTARITSTYRGNGKATISQPPDVFGSTAFTVNFQTKLPLELVPGDSFSFDVQFRPVSAAHANAQLNQPFTETAPSTTPPFSPVTVSNAINLTLQGTAPSFVLSYILQTDLNVTPLQPGGSILFPPTLINTTAQATLNVTNRGSGPGVINSISISGSAFRLLGLPLFPITVDAGQTLQLAIRYQPTVVGSDTGQIQITFAGSTTVTVNLQGSGSSSTFVYELLQTDPPTPVVPSGSIPFSDTNLGSTSSLSLRVRNAGNASGTINSINLIGPGFQLNDVPILPANLMPNASFTITLTFAPTQPGTVHGRLIIGTDSFDLAGRGLGPKLAFSYVSAGTTISLTSTGTVVFSPIMISQSEQADFIVRNTGTLATTISNIGIGEPRSPFSLSSVPQLPISLDPDAEFRFTISFTPTTTGFSNGTLRIDTTTLGLTGSGTAPPALPPYTIQGPSGNADPMSQPGVRLKLSAPYPLALVGTLTISTSGDLINDPAVQFATGGRTVSFVIPANSTDANFANQGQQIRLQTGTVASTITLTPSFATQAGGIDLTPGTPATLQFAVASAQPTLITLQASNQTANSFVLNVSGYTTTRSLTTLSVQFTPASGFNVPTTQFTIDLRQVSTLFFQSTGSQTFGGQFTIAIPFTFQGTVPAGQTVISSIKSAAVTVSNERGTSNSVQTGVQ